MSLSDPEITIVQVRALEEEEDIVLRHLPFRKHFRPQNCLLPDDFL
jgi:hypothetical protein